MSVSDPLLKKLKGFIYEFRLKSEMVTDSHPLLKDLCVTLETILHKGLKNNNSWFTKSDYWTWISKIPTLSTTERVNPILSLVIDSVKKYKKVQSAIGKGRQFIRSALVKKVLTVPIQILARSPDFTATWYDENHSILGNEILIEILQSLLFELTEVSFNLQLKNAGFLDECWDLPVFRQLELVPCEDLGLQLQCVKGYPIVTAVDPASVAGEDGKVTPGDILDEMQNVVLKGGGRSTVQMVFNQGRGYPIQLSVIKSLDADGNVFGPVGKLLKQVKSGDFSPTRESPWMDFEDKMPPEAILPDDEADEVPVHGSDSRATYDTVYLGKAYLGKDGRVAMIETGVGEVLTRSQGKQQVRMILGEKDITVTSITTGKEILHYLFTEVSACGRRTDALQYFAFIAGETYCSLAGEFYCHVFQAHSEDECQVILCTIGSTLGAFISFGAKGEIVIQCANSLDPEETPIIGVSSGSKLFDSLIVFVERN